MIKHKKSLDAMPLISCSGKTFSFWIQNACAVFVLRIMWTPKNISALRSSDNVVLTARFSKRYRVNICKQPASEVRLPLDQLSGAKNQCSNGIEFCAKKYFLAPECHWKLFDCLVFPCAPKNYSTFKKNSSVYRWLYRIKTNDCVSILC